MELPDYAKYPQKGTHALDSSLDIVPVAGPLHGSVRLPGSKSLTNRALICAALAAGPDAGCHGDRDIAALDVLAVKHPAILALLEPR